MIHTHMHTHAYDGTDPHQVRGGRDGGHAQLEKLALHQGPYRQGLCVDVCVCVVCVCVPG